MSPRFSIPVSRIQLRRPFFLLALRSVFLRICQFLPPHPLPPLSIPNNLQPPTVPFTPFFVRPRRAGQCRPRYAANTQYYLFV
ncbi:hypothetical protein DFJ73DRAFT_845583, partial [Zopfochytrium polystomum]